MSLAKLIQNAWNEQAKWLVLLRPLSCLYAGLFKFNHFLFKQGVKTSYKAPVPVLIIGNITVGGSGKTPLLIQLVKYLQQHHVKVGVISRGYGGTIATPALVTVDATAQQVGDEPCLIVQSTQVPMSVGANRQASIELLLQHYPDLQLIISDDGLQHWALQRDIEWVVLDTKRGLGNQKLLPEGYLREDVSRLNSVTVIEHHPQPTNALSMHLVTGQPYRLASKIQDIFNPKQFFHAVVGIGYPERFYQTLYQLGIEEFTQHSFADHYAYELTDIQFNDQRPIITTEKDAVKLYHLIKHLDEKPEIWVVPVYAELSSACYELLKTQLAQHHILF